MTKTAAQIISDEILAHGISRDDFFGRSRRPELVNARVTVAKRLRSERKLSQNQIGKLLNRNFRTVGHYLNANRRDARRVYLRDRWRTNLVLRHLPPEVRETVIAFAEAEDATPEIIIAQWVGERARHEVESKIRARFA